MSNIAGASYLVSTAAFALTALFISLRLIALSRRTGEKPELLMGLSFLLCAVLGYGALILAMVLRTQLPPESLHNASNWLTGLTAGGKILHDLGVVASMSFVLYVFRRNSLWERVLVGVATAVLFGGLAGYGLEGGFVDGRPGGFWYWLEFSVIGTYPLWGAFESFRYYAGMRRRRILGLADPLTTNRFALWGSGSVTTVLAIWTVMSPVLFGEPLAPGARMEPNAGALLATSVFGMATVLLYCLTFFPPRWYRSRLMPVAEEVES